MSTIYKKINTYMFDVLPVTVTQPHFCWLKCPFPPIWSVAYHDSADGRALIHSHLKAKDMRRSGEFINPERMNWGN